MPKLSRYLDTWRYKTTVDVEPMTTRRSAAQRSAAVGPIMANASLSTGATVQPVASTSRRTPRSSTTTAAKVAKNDTALEVQQLRAEIQKLKEEAKEKEEQDVVRRRQAAASLATSELEAKRLKLAYNTLSIRNKETKKNFLSYKTKVASQLATKSFQLQKKEQQVFQLTDENALMREKLRNKEEQAVNLQEAMDSNDEEEIRRAEDLEKELALFRSVNEGLRGQLSESDEEHQRRAAAVSLDQAEKKIGVLEKLQEEKKESTPAPRVRRNFQ